MELCVNSLVKHRVSTVDTAPSLEAAINSFKMNSGNVPDWYDLTIKITLVKIEDGCITNIEYLNPKYNGVIIQCLEYKVLYTLE